jgi:hypothetical protein
MLVGKTCGEPCGESCFNACLVYYKCSDEELNESMSAGNDDIVQQLNRAVARASINPEDTMGNIDAQIAARRRLRKAGNIDTPDG